MFGRYRLEESLGSAGVTDAWRAHDEELDRPVTVKLLHRKLVPDELTINIWKQYLQGMELINQFHSETEIIVLDGLPRSPWARWPSLSRRFTCARPQL